MTIIAWGRKFSPDLSGSGGMQKSSVGACISARFCRFFLIGYRAPKYSSWNEKQIKTFLTLDSKWTTNPWALCCSFFNYVSSTSVSFSPLLGEEAVYTQIKFWTDKSLKHWVSSGLFVDDLLRTALNIHHRWLTGFTKICASLANALLRFLLCSVLGYRLCEWISSL